MPADRHAALLARSKTPSCRRPAQSRSHWLPLALLVSGCAAALPVTPVQVGKAAPLELAGMGTCEGSPADGEVALDPDRPLVVLVHGSHSTPQSFRALAEVFALQGQQSVCFRYDDRARVTGSARVLRQGLALLSHRLRQPQVTVLGHSQGGLVARTALGAFQAPQLRLRPGEYRLVTVSSPFGGIRAAANCGSIPYHIASLGVSLVVCRAISGQKWNQIHPRARILRSPLALDPAVREHLTIITDERDTCRRYSPDGLRCLQDDFVFTLAEQHNARITRDQRVIEAPLSAGHVAVLGAHGSAPTALRRVLQRHGLLRDAPTERQLARQGSTSQHGL